ncbi:MAG: precorrin-8X methylmutase [Omnitrophica bacterium]|nr:precorrin-8X methylmutase [Candidatus Omnitrophota bacterium]
MAILSSPKKIEARSFEIIEGHLRGVKLHPLAKPIVKRVIHATADVSFARGLLFHHGALKAGINAIKEGKTIVVDANMVKAGINKKLLKAFGSRLICRLDSKRVAKEFLLSSATRSQLAMRASIPWMKDGIVVVGNAPTALFELCRLVKEKKTRPSLVVGIPVGFVGAREAKRKLRTLGVPYITNNGRKGGSACAVAIVNALLIMASEEKLKL